MGRKLIVFDTTLRDGEQAPGYSMSREAKLRFAKQLARLGVDVIEAGFPVSSTEQFEAVKMIAGEVEGPIIAALARAVEKDIKSAYEALLPAPKEKRRIHTFIATSPIHMKYKLKKTPEEVLKITKEAVGYAKSLVDDVEFSAEDATRSDLSFLLEVFEVAVEAGATTLNIPDTVGYTVPSEFEKIVRAVVERFSPRGINISVHCHNDLGLAVANTLTAVLAGANQVEVTVNGIGERAGNAALEEVVMTVKVRKDIFKDIELNINTKEIYRTSRLLVALTGVGIQPNKAIVGRNAFAHESGIHQDGVIKERTTYEIMSPEDIGRPTSELVLGRHSGRHALKVKLEELGYELPEDVFEKLYEEFKALADRKKAVYDDDLLALLEEVVGEKPTEVYELEYVQVTTGRGVKPTATVVLKKGHKVYEEAAIGNGPVDAVYKAIDRIVKIKDLVLEDYSVNAVTAGTDAMGEVTLTVRYKDNYYSSHGIDTDIIVASAKAYINAINKIITIEEKKTKKQTQDTLTP